MQKNDRRTGQSSNEEKLTKTKTLAILQTINSKFMNSKFNNEFKVQNTYEIYSRAIHKDVTNSTIGLNLDPKHKRLKSGKL